jgi:hypothetical protein
VFEFGIDHYTFAHGYLLNTYLVSFDL